MKTKLLIGVGVVVALASAGYVGYSVGRIKAALHWAWVPKEHNHLAGSMERIEVLLSRGDTTSVLRAVGAYNSTIKAMTNEFDFYRAADTLSEHTKEK